MVSLFNTNKKNLTKYLFYQLPAILWMVAIFIQSSIPDLSAPDLGFRTQDKFAHTIEYGILAVLLCRFFIYNKKIKWQNKWYLYTLLIGSSYALLDEIHQAFVPGRTADVYDVVADIVGVLIVVNIYKFLKRKENSAYIS